MGLIIEVALVEIGVFAKDLDAQPSQVRNEAVQFTAGDTGDLRPV